MAPPSHLAIFSLPAPLRIAPHELSPRSNFVPLAICARRSPASRGSRYPLLGRYPGRRIISFNAVPRLDQQSGDYLPGGITSGSAGLMSPAGVTVGPDGNIYVSSQGTGEILFYEGSSGAALPSPLPGGRDGLFATLRTDLTPTARPGRCASDPTAISTSPTSAAPTSAGSTGRPASKRYRRPGPPLLVHRPGWPSTIPAIFTLATSAAPA